MLKCLGIYRELQNSPNRQSDDALILEAVRDNMASIGLRMDILRPEQADAADLGAWDLILPMCETYPRLMRLKSAGAPSINPPAAVLSCYRVPMREAFRANPAIAFPPTVVRAVAQGGPLEEPSFDSGSGFWVKRGDVHNTCLHDVVFARDLAGAEEIRKDFAQREISHLLLQQHIDGDLIKFYGVGPRRWFTWFYHDPESARRFPFSIDAMAEMAAAGASALGLEIFGGDAIITPQGGLWLIDINSWPSFARVRAEAARQIASHVSSRVERVKARQ